MESPGYPAGDELAAPPGFCNEIGGLWPIGPVRAILVVASAPSLHLFRGQSAGVRNQCAFVRSARTLLSNASAKGEGAVRRLARPAEVERDAAGGGPEVEVPGDELGAPSSTRIVFQIADRRAHPIEGLKRLNHILGAVAGKRCSGDHLSSGGLRERFEAFEGFGT